MSFKSLFLVLVGILCTTPLSIAAAASGPQDALFEAISRGKLSEVKELCESGSIDINIKSSPADYRYRSKTPLEVAFTYSESYGGNDDIWGYLLTRPGITITESAQETIISKCTSSLQALKNIAEHTIKFTKDRSKAIAQSKLPAFIDRRDLQAMVAQDPEVIAAHESKAAIWRKHLKTLRQCIIPSLSTRLTKENHNDLQAIPLFVLIDNTLTGLAFASDTNTTCKRLIQDFFSTTIINDTGRPTIIKDYFTAIANNWEASRTYPTDAEITANIRHARSCLPEPDPVKTTITVMSLPSLLQAADTARMLYLNPTQPAQQWDMSCAFYAVFHLVNAWKYRDNPVAMAKHLSRNNFSEFLALLQSGKELIPSLERTTVDPRDIDYPLFIRKRFYPSITKDLEWGARLILGGIGPDFEQYLIASYGFLKKIDDFAMQYAPTFTNFPATKLSYAHSNDEFIAPYTAYLKSALTQQHAFVFPLFIGTKKHASSALIYKLQTARGKPTQFYVFFAESNRNEGHRDSRDSSVGEALNFATTFKQLVGILTDQSETNINIAGPTETLAVNDLYSLLKFCSNQIAAGGAVYNWNPLPEGAAAPAPVAALSPTLGKDMARAIINGNVEELSALCAQAKTAINDIKLHIPSVHTPSDFQLYTPLAFLAYVGANGLPHTRAETAVMHRKKVNEKKAQMANILCNAGANPTVKVPYSNKGTLFHYALANQSNKIFKTLCLNKNALAAVNTVNERGNTPLHSVLYNREEAILKNRFQYAKLLCEAGANLTITNDSGKTPLALAEAIGDAQLITLLRSHAR